MSVRLEVSGLAAASVQAVWEEVVDWAGQYRWIPFTTVDVVSEQHTGLGVRAEALSGFRLAGRPIGLLDRFIVTGWRPPAEGRAELEVLHLGPYFTGEGVFALAEDAGQTRITCTEMINVPGGRLTELGVRALLPVMRRGFRASLGSLSKLAESSPSR